MDQKFYIGADIGKTKIAVGIVDAQGNVISKEVKMTDISDAGAHVLGQCEAIVSGMLSKSDVKISGLGVCIFSIVGSNGIITMSSMGNLRGAKMKEHFEKRFGIPVCADNDVMAAARGEMLFGAGKKTKNFVFLTISTGTCACSVIEGKILRGVHNLAGEIGILKSPGAESFAEEAFSGGGIQRNFEKATGKSVSTEGVFRLAKKGDKTAGEIIETAATGAADALAWIHAVIDPEMFVLAGSVALKQPDFVERVRTKLKGRFLVEPKIVISAQGGDTGIIGAASLCVINERLD